MDDKILITKEDGTEVEMTILLTFDHEGKSFVLYYDENDESGQVFPFIYKEEDHSLEELKDEEDWEVANEVLESFLNKE